LCWRTQPNLQAEQLIALTGIQSADNEEDCYSGGHGQDE